MTIDHTSAAGVQRADVVQGLIDLAAFLTTHPEVPIWAQGLDLTWFPGGSDAERLDGVDHIASLIGEAPERRTSGNYQVTRHFGPVSYVAVALETRTARRVA
jgi:hypothetical protein